MSDIIVYPNRHRSVVKLMEIVVGDCCEISGDKIAVCEKTAGLRIGNFSDLNSACSKVLVPVKNVQFQDIYTWEMKVNDIGTQQTA